MSWMFPVLTTAKFCWATTAYNRKLCQQIINLAKGFHPAAQGMLVTIQTRINAFFYLR